MRTLEDTEIWELWRNARSGPRDAIHKRLRKALFSPGTPIFALSILTVFALIALLAPVLAPYGPFEVVFSEDGTLMRRQPPSAEYWLGTTGYGHDVMSQVIYGSRVAFMVGISAAVAVGIISTIMGTAAGYFGGLTDDLLMRFTDFAMALPTLPMAIVATAVLGPGLENVILVIAALYWRNGARIIRSVVLSEKQKPYVQAALMAGGSHLYVIARHILPNVMRVVLLWMTVSVAFSMVTEASLSFIGLGDPSQVSWGQMLNAAFSTGAIRTDWWWGVPPSLAMVMCISSLYFIGRAYESRLDPGLRAR